MEMSLHKLKLFKVLNTRTVYTSQRTTKVFWTKFLKLPYH